MLPTNWTTTDGDQMTLTLATPDSNILSGTYTPAGGGSYSLTGFIDFIGIDDYSAICWTCLIPEQGVNYANTWCGFIGPGPTGNTITASWTEVVGDPNNPQYSTVQIAYNSVPQ